MDTATLHQYGPWLLLAAGVAGLLQVTVLYRALQRGWPRLLEAGLPRGHPLLPIAEGAMQSPALRWFGAAWSLALLLAAAAWLALRP